MAALTIRNLDDDVKAKLRIRAAHNGRSMEAEVREILADAVDAPSHAGASQGSVGSPAKYRAPVEPDVDAADGVQRSPGDQGIHAMLDAMGIDDVREELSPEQIDDIRRLVYEAGVLNENMGQAIARVFSELGGVTLDIPRSGREARWADFEE